MVVKALRELIEDELLYCHIEQNSNEERTLKKLIECRPRALAIIKLLECNAIVFEELRKQFYVNDGKSSGGYATAENLSTTTRFEKELIDSIKFLLPLFTQEANIIQAILRKSRNDALEYVGIFGNKPIITPIYNGIKNTIKNFFKGEQKDVITYYESKMDNAFLNLQNLNHMANYGRPS